MRILMALLALLSVSPAYAASCTSFYGQILSTTQNCSDMGIAINWNDCTGRTDCPSQLSDQCLAAHSGQNPSFVTTYGDNVNNPTRGVCFYDGPGCPPAGTEKSSGFYDIGTNPETPVPTQTCDGGCETSYTGSGVTKRAMISGIYHYFYGSGGYYYTGQECTTGSPSPNSGPVPPNGCNSATQSTGQVNGVTVCVPKNDTNNTNTTTTPPTTDPTTGDTTTTTNTTNVNTTNNTTTTTTTTTTTSPDGTVTQTTADVITKNPPSNFCQVNPTDPTCLKNSKFCEDNPETLGCATLGTVTDSVVPTVEKGIADITPKTVGGAGSCPAPVTASFMGRTVSFSYDLPCQAAGMLKPLILALAWLAAGVIFIGGVRQ